MIQYLMEISIDKILYGFGDKFFRKLERNSNIQDCKKIDNIPSDKIINITIINNETLTQTANRINNRIIARHRAGNHIRENFDNLCVKSKVFNLALFI